jgi:hypothetical protein
MTIKDGILVVVVPSQHGSVRVIEITAIGLGLGGEPASKTEHIDTEKK